MRKWTIFAGLLATFLLCSWALAASPERAQGAGAPQPQGRTTRPPTQLTDRARPVEAATRKAGRGGDDEARSFGRRTMPVGYTEDWREISSGRVHTPSTGPYAPFPPTSFVGGSVSTP